MDPDVVRADRARARRSAAVDHKRLEIHRTDLWRRLAPILADHDALLCPTMAVAAVAGGEGRPARRSRRRRRRLPLPRHDRRVQPGLPVPGDLGAVRAPRSRRDAGLPIGLQIVGRRWREDTVLRIARAVELTSGDR